MAAALAVMAARRGLRVLLAAVQAKDRLGDMLGCEPLGPTNRQIRPGIDAVNMVPERNLEEYAMMALKLRALYRIVLGNDRVQSFLAGVPGLYDWALLGKATFHALERRPDGTDRYDLVILDAPATGHGLDLLRVPLTLTEAVPAGPMREEALERWELLRDPARHLVLPVTLPEEMAVTETIELLERLDTMGLVAHDVLVNKMLPPLFDPEDRDLLERLDLGGAVGEAIDAGRYRAGWQKVQTDQMSRLRQEVSQRAVMIPHMLASAMGPETIEALSLALEALLAPLPTHVAA